MVFRHLRLKNPWRLSDIIWSTLFEVTNFFEQGSLFCGFLMLENLLWLRCCLRMTVALITQ